MRGSLAIRQPKCLTSRYVYVSWFRPAGDQVASGGHLPDPRSGCRLEEADRGFPGAAGGVTEPDRLPQGPTRPSPPPGPSPGGSLLQRPTPRPSQTARTQTRPGTVLVPRSSRPRLGHRASRGGWSDGAVCPWCGQPLEEAGVESASTTEIPPHPQPTVRFYRVHVYRCRSCGKRVRASHPDLAPDQYGPPPIGWVRG